MRIGEFHTVLCAIRVIGTFIENTGIDDSWVESGIYGTATAPQIMKGRHVKRSVNAHCITLQVLFDLFFEAFKSDMDSSQMQMALFVEEKCESFPNFHAAWQYMDMVFSLLQFIQASREGSWLLYQASLDKICPYYRLEYALHVPGYIARMYKLQESDADIGDFLMN